MADDRLKNFVLSLADADYTLSEQVRLVVLAALEGSNDLAEVLGDDAPRTKTDLKSFGPLVPRPTPVFDIWVRPNRPSVSVSASNVTRDGASSPPR
jgi:hypothetical protein